MTLHIILPKWEHDAPSIQFTIVNILLRGIVNILDYNMHPNIAHKKKTA